MKRNDVAKEESVSVDPPVLPSWGSMLPPVPSAGYGDMSFDCEESVGEPAARPKRALTDLDREAINLLPSLLPTKSRT